ncbi:hypothetical protein HYW76_00770 [Candidatus Pacearchaeota archaeon]|nr:hypothetical protein [Candidatus Pacearchaeota archaeon]
MKKGKLVVIEGGDCSGKETQSALLVNRLHSEGILCGTISFPQYDTPTGRIIGQCYLGKTDLGEQLGWKGDYCWFGNPNSVQPIIASLYYAADRQALAPEIRRILNSGQHLVFNRYVESNIGHQSGKLKDSGERRTLAFLIETLEYDLLGLPRPDGLIFLHMPWQVALELRKSRQGVADGHENAEHLKNTETAYLEYIRGKKYPIIPCTRDGTLKTLRDKKDIAQDVYEEARRILLS